eukprot:3045672-Amphidinium_carterae.2
MRASYSVEPGWCNRCSIQSSAAEPGQACRRIPCVLVRSVQALISTLQLPWKKSSVLRAIMVVKVQHNSEVNCICVSLIGTALSLNMDLDYRNPKTTVE